MQDIAIAEQWGSHLLLVSSARGFAVVERRRGMIYSIRGAARRDCHPDTPDGILAAVGEDGWQDEARMRALFRRLIEQGEALARNIW